MGEWESQCITEIYAFVVVVNIHFSGNQQTSQTLSLYTNLSILS